MREETRKPGERGSADLTCSEVEKSLEAYVEGELEGHRLHLVARHVESCGNCAARCLEYQRERLRLIEAAVDSPELPESFARKVAARALAERRRALAARWRDAFFRVSGAVAAAAMLLLAVSVGTGPEVRDGDRPQPARSPSALKESFGRTALAGIPKAAPPSPTFRERAASELAMLPEVHDAVFAAYRLGPRGSGVWVPEQQALCLPDPNNDGRSDINDVAFSFQLLLPDRPPALAGHEEEAADPDCVDICLKL